MVYAVDIPNVSSDLLQALLVLGVVILAGLGRLAKWLADKWKESQARRKAQEASTRQPQARTRTPPPRAQPPTPPAPRGGELPRGRRPTPKPRPAAVIEAVIVPAAEAAVEAAPSLVTMAPIAERQRDPGATIPALALPDLADPAQLRAAILHYEIFSPPLALRPSTSGWDRG